MESGTMSVCRVPSSFHSASHAWDRVNQQPSSSPHFHFHFLLPPREQRGPSPPSQRSAGTTEQSPILFPLLLRVLHLHFSFSPFPPFLLSPSLILSGSFLPTPSYASFPFSFISPFYLSSSSSHPPPPPPPFPLVIPIHTRSRRRATEKAPTQRQRVFVQYYGVYHAVQ